ncbi:ERF family protein [Dyadobacter sp. CY356]|uniref:ERF family protein n=1 Tax=Dyadobacter sp. CY356 TaxID=2906442 RepID=UPI001F3B6983|nr:ERF family protein [Dyadobacter sp. CY356]MCF0055549.1 ERF family protein [Dyadobacter sp. CY356]
MSNKHVYEAIAAITGKMSKEGISKDRKNQMQGYNFRGIDDVLNALSPMLAEEKLNILPRVIERECVERQTAKGGAIFYTTVKVEFDFVSAVDGSIHTVCTFGEAMDSADKSTNKAMSAAYKYAAFLAFCIPTEGEDADAVTHVITPKVDLITPERKTFIIDMVNKETDITKLRTIYPVIKKECQTANDEPTWKELEKLITDKVTQLQPPQETTIDTTN